MALRHPLTRQEAARRFTTADDQRAGYNENAINQAPVNQRLELVPANIPLESQILNSWKEIAQYLGRGLRTVQRWESELRLPIHRPRGKYRSAVIAFKEELDAWLRCTPALLRNGDGDTYNALLTIATRLHNVGQELVARADPQTESEAKNLVESLNEIVRELAVKNGDSR